MWKKPSQVRERVVFAEFDWKFQFFWNLETEQQDLKFLYLNYWSDLLLGSVQAYFLEAGAYLSLKGGTTDVCEGGFCWIRLEISPFLKYKNGRVGPKNFIV